MYNSVYQFIHYSISFSTILYINLYIIALNVYHFVHFHPHRKFSSWHSTNYGEEGRLKKGIEGEEGRVRKERKEG